MPSGCASVCPCCVMSRDGKMLGYKCQGGTTRIGKDVLCRRGTPSGALTMCFMYCHHVTQKPTSFVTKPAQKKKYPLQVATGNLCEDVFETILLMRQE